MSHYNPLQAMPWLVALFAALLTSAMGESPTVAKDKHQIRIVCASLLNENQNIILAKTKDGNVYDEIAKAELRSSKITEWLPAEAGELHIAVKEANSVKSICRFTYPEDASHGLVILIADEKTKTQNAHFVDPQKAKFEKGTFFVFNLSTKPASVFLGPTEEKIEASQQVVVKPTPEANGMFRMQVTRPGKNDITETCYDRFVPGRQDSREMLFLVEDENAILRVITLPLFSEFE